MSFLAFRRFPAVLTAVSLLTAVGPVALGQTPPQPAFTPDQLQFFERQVAPILKANCVACHGAETKVQSGLYLTSREGALRGGENGPAVSLASPDKSALLDAINYRTFEMPPKGKLPQAQIDVLTRWVEMGLPWPAGEAGVLVQHGPPKVDDRARNFWSFRPVVRPAVPAVKDQGWVRNPIDRFVLARLEKKGLRPAKPADKPALLRRLYYSVTGLPPNTEDVDAFVSDSSDRAYEKVVEKLLDSRHYGEHWGRHWLDLVRYAETNSFERDNPKPFVWRYRDYVIRSLNDDKTYDQFIREQLAGDELDEVTPETIIATGYYRLGLWDDEPADPVLAYYDGLDDIVATTGQTFLGLTVNCARCHDHKIDPFPQRDYYQLLAFFHGIKHYGNRSDESVAAASLRSIATPEERERFRDVLAAYDQQVATLDRQLAEVEEPIQAKLSGGERDDFRSPRSRVSILRKRVGELISREELERYAALRRDRDRLDRERPKPAEQALAVKEDSQPRETFVLLRGNPQNKGERVEPGFPAVLMMQGAEKLEWPPAGQGASSSGRRRALAEWIASPTNPLTSRVMVNRVWQYHFGRGIVRTASNFGYQGSPPTHPELLDWLASELASGGMKLKTLHRLILTSNTFRMSGEVDPAAAKVDPENDLLSHFDLRRLSAEEIRDSILAVCGSLNLTKQDGPSVYPPISAEVLAGQSRPGYGWSKSTPADAAARSVFVHVKRSLALPILAAFDAPDPDAPCPVRFTTTQPTQALAMLNSEFLNSQAGVFARLAIEKTGSEPTARVAFILRRVLQRVPTEAEIERGVKFLATSQEGEKMTAEEALRRFCLLALNLNEFVYLE
jgi:mono/diheme cytochrome c family protein